MVLHVHAASQSWALLVLLGATLLLAASLYIRGWLLLRELRLDAVPFSRACCFLFGLLLIWAALGSPIASYHHDLLIFHMVEHLLLMTFAPALLLLGEPMRVFWSAVPQSAQNSFGAAFHQPLLRRFASWLANPVLCWSVSAITLIGWHIPVLFTLGLRSDAWHASEQASFFVAGILFWWPVIRPWPSSSTAAQWPILLYLFLATLPCDILSGFLVFSDRVVYPVYFSAPRLFGLSALADQQCAGALMWTCVTIVYLLPAAILTTRLLAPRHSRETMWAQPDLQSPARAAAHKDR